MRILVSGVLTATVVLFTPGLAEAKSHTHNDRAGDVWFGPAVPSSGKRVPRQVEGDVTRVQIKHNRAYVQLFMTLRDIKRETLGKRIGFKLQNRRKQITNVEVGAFPQSGFPEGRMLIEDYFGRPRTCAGTKGFRIDWDSNVVAVTIPRTCVGNAKFVRTQAWSSHYHDSSGSYRDDALTVKDPFEDKRGWTPWVRRG